MRFDEDRCVVLSLDWPRHIWRLRMRACFGEDYTPIGGPGGAGWHYPEGAGRHLDTSRHRLPVAAPGIPGLASARMEHGPPRGSAVRERGWWWRLWQESDGEG